MTTDKSAAPMTAEEMAQFRVSMEIALRRNCISPAHDECRLLATIDARDADVSRLSAEVERLREGPLWAVHVRGSDDFNAVESYEAAVAFADWCRDQDRKNAGSPHKPMLNAVIALWPGTAEDHAAEIARTAAEVADLNARRAATLTQEASNG